VACRRSRRGRKIIDSGPRLRFDRILDAIATYGWRKPEMSTEMAGDESIFPRIASSRATRLSNWVTVVENRVIASPLDEGAIYHSIDTMDYVSVLALTADYCVPLVRQFRPAVRRFTLEFPGGLRDGEEAPESSAIRELGEEAGLAISSVQSLATFIPESGRLGNRMWTYFARDAVPIPAWRPEHGVERVMVSVQELVTLALDGSFDHAPHLAMLGMAIMKGLLPRPQL
jgi:ADP-ribose pyrophosphatase